MAKHLDPQQLEEPARKHLWVYFAQLSSSGEVPVIVRGEGCHVFDANGLQGARPRTPGARVAAATLGT
jgi:hypothetical protein